MDVALLTKHVISYCHKKNNNVVFAIHFIVANSHLTSCTLLTRQSALVLKMDVLCTLQSLQRKTGF